MRYFCPACGTAHTSADEAVPPEGSSVDCGKCGFSIKLKPSEQEPEEEAGNELPASSEGEREMTKTDDQTNEEAQPSAEKGRSIPYPGCCRSGKRFRFRDMFFALKAPLDLRKTLAAAAGVLAGSVLLILIFWLASLTKSQVGLIIGLILGFALFLACVYLGLGVSTWQANREMLHGGYLPLSEGIDFIKSRALTVVGFPFLFGAGIVVLGTGIALFHLMARIPYAGPILFGLTYGAVFTLGVLAILIGTLFIFVEVSYIPAAKEHGIFGLATHMWRLVRRKPGRYALHVLVIYLVAAVLAVALGWILTKALFLIGMIDGRVGGGEYSKILLSQPGGLFPLLELLFPSGLGVGVGQGWQFIIAGWLVFIVNLVVFSLFTGFVTTYMFAAGAVNYHLLNQDEKAD